MNGEKADKEPRGFVDPLVAVDRDTTLSAEMVDSEFMPTSHAVPLVRSELKSLSDLACSLVVNEWPR